MKAFIALVIVWVVLALSTLYLVVQNESTLTAALVAWTGGVITCLIAEHVTLFVKTRRKPV